MQRSLLTALAFAATQATALTHGEKGQDGDGAPIVWQQVAQGVFHGVPEAEWDPTVKIRGNQEWDVDEISARTPTSTSGHRASRDLAIESRNLKSNCQAEPRCIKSGSSSSHVLNGINIWLDLATYASNDSGMDIMDFLKAPFTADVNGISLVGQVSGDINDNTKTECSTSEISADQIGAVLNTLASQNPKAESLGIRVKGPSGSWSISMAAGAEGDDPSQTCKE